jgi:hypothetical protein
MYETLVGSRHGGLQMRVTRANKMLCVNANVTHLFNDALYN